MEELNIDGYISSGGLKHSDWQSLSGMTVNGPVDSRDRTGVSRHSVHSSGLSLSFSFYLKN